MTAWFGVLCFGAGWLAGATTLIAVLMAGEREYR